MPAEGHRRSPSCCPRVSGTYSLCSRPPHGGFFKQQTGAQDNKIPPFGTPQSRGRQGYAGLGSAGLEAAQRSQLQTRSRCPARKGRPVPRVTAALQRALLRGPLLHARQRGEATPRPRASSPESAGLRPLDGEPFLGVQPSPGAPPPSLGDPTSPRRRAALLPRSLRSGGKRRYWFLPCSDCTRPPGSHVLLLPAGDRALQGSDVPAGSRREGEGKAPRRGCPSPSCCTSRLPGRPRTSGQRHRPGACPGAAGGGRGQRPTAAPNEESAEIKSRAGRL